jgi:hypothetical protein
LNQISDLSKEKSKTPALIVGSAPNIRKIKGKLFNGVKIGVGDVPWRAPELGPFKYWVSANTLYPMPWKKKDKRAWLNSKSHLLLSSASVVQSNLDWLAIQHELKALALINDITFYDQRHFDGKPCEPSQNCCKFSKELISDLPIQQLLSQEIGEVNPAYSSGSTVALQGLALALILQYNPVYIIGVELPKTFGNYKTYKNYKMPNEKIWAFIKRHIKYFLPHYKYSTNIDFANNYGQIIQDFQSIIEIAGKLGIRVISLSKTSPLNDLHGVEVGDLIKSEHFR